MQKRQDLFCISLNCCQAYRGDASGASADLNECPQPFAMLPVGQK